MSPPHAIAKMDTTAAYAETLRIAALRAEFRAAAAALSAAGDEANRLVENCCPVAQAVGDEADQVYGLGQELIIALDGLARLMNRLSHSPRLGA
jgi:hypothetical protein